MKTIYLAPSDLEQVLETLRKDPDGTILMAGGTALLWAIRLLGISVMPRRVVGLQNLQGLLGQVKYGPEMDLGALVSLAKIAGETPEETGIPCILSQAAGSCGFPGIRRAATLGGNLANVVMPSQLLPALAALGASVHICSSSAQRRVDLAKNISEGDYYPIVAPGDIITSVSIPMDGVQARQSYVDFTCPGKDPVVVASAFWRGRLRVVLLSAQKLYLWDVETGGSLWEQQEVELAAEAACESFGLADAYHISQIDAYRERAMVAKAIKLTMDRN